MKYVYILLTIPFFFSCEQKEQTSTNSEQMGFIEIETTNEQLTYPETEQDNTMVNTYFDTEIDDPYHWLEDDNSTETEAWVTAQNELTNSYMQKIEFRDDVRNRLEQLYDYTKFSAPFKEGDNYFYFKQDGLQNQSVLYKTSSIDEDGEVFLDPNQLSEDGTVAISNISVSNDAKYFAYAQSNAGSDWKTLLVKNADTGEDLADKIEWAKFTGIAWQGNGFYYGAYPTPEEGTELSSSNEQMRVYYHKIGTAQTEDDLVFEDSVNTKKYFGARVTDDEKYLIITGGMGTSGNDLRVKDLANENADFVVVKEDMETDAAVIGNNGDDLYMITNQNAPNMRVVKFNLNNPTEWADVIPEGEHVLSSVTKAGGKLFAKYIEDVKHKVYQFSLAGELEKEVDLPGAGTVYGFGGKDDDTDLFYTYTSITQPPSIYQFNVESGDSKVFKSPEIDFDADQYETKQVFYPSKDGTKVPMYIVHKKGIELDGNNPTWLYAYGGFDISIMPRFNSILVSWLEQGGIYALANIRGGSEYGSKWHDSGRLLNKQNVFDDFISAAEYLIDNDYTTSSKLAVNGRSNGGLLIGAVMTQRPDLFGVCIPAVGVLDMLKYENFTIGYAWASDYGSVKDEEHFKNLLSYSPLHNIKKDVSYPPTMVITADHDDRVVPAHSFKFTSRLQEFHQGENPVLIRVDVDSGHGSGKPTSKILDEWADVYSFTMYNLGVAPSY